MEKEKRVRMALVGGGTAWVLPSDVRVIRPHHVRPDASLLRLVVGRNPDSLEVVGTPDEIEATLRTPAESSSP